MTKTIFGTLLAVIVFTVLCSFSTMPSKTYGKIRVDVTITSAEGCTFHIVGEVTYSIFPPRITDFDGTVTIGGGRNCPRGTFNFRRVAANMNELSEVVSIDLSEADGDAQALETLVSPDVEPDLKLYLTAICQQ